MARFARQVLEVPEGNTDVDAIRKAIKAELALHRTTRALFKRRDLIISIFCISVE